MSMALMLFLVCTVISAVVLAAGTTAAGRLAELRNVNRRYYGVNSAVGVFKEMLADGDWQRDNRVMVTRSCMVTASDDDISKTEDSDSEYVVWVDNKKVADSAEEGGATTLPSSLFLNLSLDYLFGKDSSSLKDGRSIDARDLESQLVIGDTIDETQFDDGSMGRSIVQDLTSEETYSYEPIEISVSGYDGRIAPTYVKPTLIARKGDDGVPVVTLELRFADDPDNPTYTVALDVAVEIEHNTRCESVTQDVAGGTNTYKVSTDTTFTWTGGDPSL